MTADAGFMDEDGYVYIMARTDDVINVAGHRLSTGAMEEVLSRHQDVAECAVLGVADSFKGQLPVGFIVLKSGVTKPHEQIIKEVVQMVRDQIGPVAAFKTAAVVDRLPKTRSGKILRGTIQKIADNEPWKMPATIDDPAILDEIKGALEGSAMRAPARKRRLPALSSRHRPSSDERGAGDGFALYSSPADLYCSSAGSDHAPCTVPARARARSTSFCRSASLQRPRLTGFRGLMSADRQWVRSRTLSMVGLVVPISLQI